MWAVYLYLAASCTIILSIGGNETSFDIVQELERVSSSSVSSIISHAKIPIAERLEDCANVKWAAGLPERGRRGRKVR